MSSSCALGYDRLRAVLGSVLLAWVVAVPAEQPLATVGEIDLARYMGRWYQIALLPNRFQAFCVGDTTAEYQVRDNGLVQVVNQCRDSGGTLRRAEGVARRNPRYDDPARLQVRFAPAWLGWLPFVWGDYWIVALEADYSAVLVGAPNREYLWILAREPRLAAAVFARFTALARDAGFAVDALVLERPDAVRTAPD